MAKPAKHRGRLRVMGKRKEGRRGGVGGKWEEPDGDEKWLHLRQALALTQWNPGTAELSPLCQCLLILTCPRH